MKTGFTNRYTSLTEVYDLITESFEIFNTEEVDDVHSFVVPEEAQAAAETEIDEAAQMGTQVCFDIF